MGKHCYIIHIDELSMPHRPQVEPVETDREVWVERAPPDDELEEWAQLFGEVEDVYRLPSRRPDTLGERGYVLFKEHEAARKCIEAGIALWSESERALAWQGAGRHTAKWKHTYPESIVARILGSKGARINELRESCGFRNLFVRGESLSRESISKRLHFIAEGGKEHGSLRLLRDELEIM